MNAEVPGSFSPGRLSAGSNERFGRCTTTLMQVPPTIGARSAQFASRQQPAFGQRVGGLAGTHQNSIVFRHENGGYDCPKVSNYYTYA